MRLPERLKGLVLAVRIAAASSCLLLILRIVELVADLRTLLECGRSREQTAESRETLGELIESVARLYNFDELLAREGINANTVDLIRAMIDVESGFNFSARRFEPGYAKRYLDKRKINELARYARTSDLEVISTSYGYMQVMYPTAVFEMNFKGRPEDLYNPVVNLVIGMGYLRKQAERTGSIRGAL